MYYKYEVICILFCNIHTENACFQRYFKLIFKLLPIKAYELLL